MAYPRLLNLSPETEEKLVAYLTQELYNHYSERDQRLQQILQWQKDYWAEPVKKRATFPFAGASTLIIPSTAIASEALHARFMTTLFSLDDIVSAKAKSDVWADAARPYEKYFNEYLRDDVKVYKFADNFLLEDIKFGNGIGKAGYVCIKKKSIRRVGDTEQEFDVTIKEGAALDTVSVGRFLMPYVAQDPQMAPWVGEEHTIGLYEMKIEEESGLFYPGTYERLLPWAINNTSGTMGQERQFEQNQQRLEKTEPIFPRLIDFQELWLGWELIEGEPPVEIQVFFHYPTRSLIAARYNDYSDLHRPYRTAQFFPLEHRWLGIGICKMNEQFQREITQIHRQRLDGGTLSNMGMLKVHKMSGYGPKEPIFPGKMWFLDDMSHIESFSLTDIQPSSYANENSTVIYSQQRTGVNEVTLGMPQVGTPGTATSDLARIQEGKAKYDFALRNVKECFTDLLTDVACIMQQYGSKDVRYYAYNGAEYIQQVLTLPEQFIRDGLIFNFAVNSQSQNKILDQQQAQQVAAFTQQYWVGMLQLAQESQNPEIIQQIMMKAAQSSTEVFRQLLESMDIKNIDRIILNLGQEGNAPRQSQLVSGPNQGSSGIIT